MRPLTAQISSTGWSGCVYVLHSLPSTSTRTATRNLSFIKTQQSWTLVIIVPARARTRPFPSSAAPTERPCGLSNKTDPTGRVRFRVQSHFGLGVSLKCLYNLEIQNDGIPLFLTISCVLFFHILSFKTSLRTVLTEQRRRGRRQVRRNGTRPQCPIPENT